LHAPSTQHLGVLNPLDGGPLREALANATASGWVTATHSLVNRKCDSIAIPSEPFQQIVQVIGLERASLVEPYSQVRPGPSKRR